MNQTYPIKRVKMALRKFDFFPINHGNGSGHDVWCDSAGHEVHPVMRKRDVPYAYLYALATALVGQGVCVSRAEFLDVVKRR